MANGLAAGRETFTWSGPIESNRFTLGPGRWADMEMIDAPTGRRTLRKLSGITGNPVNPETKITLHLAGGLEECSPPITKWIDESTYVPGSGLGFFGRAVGGDASRGRFIEIIREVVSPDILANPVGFIKSVSFGGVTVTTTKLFTVFTPDYYIPPVDSDPAQDSVTRIKNSDWSGPLAVTVTITHDLYGNPVTPVDYSYELDIPTLFQLPGCEDCVPPETDCWRCYKRNMTAVCGSVGATARIVSVTETDTNYSISTGEDGIPIGYAPLSAGPDQSDPAKCWFNFYYSSPVQSSCPDLGIGVGVTLFFLNFSLLSNGEATVLRTYSPVKVEPGTCGGSEIDQNIVLNGFGKHTFNQPVWPFDSLGSTLPSVGYITIEIETFDLSGGVEPPEVNEKKCFSGNPPEGEGWTEAGDCHATEQECIDDCGSPCGGGKCSLIASRAAEMATADGLAGRLWENAFRWTTPGFDTSAPDAVGSQQVGSTSAIHVEKTPYIPHGGLASFGGVAGGTRYHWTFNANTASWDGTTSADKHIEITAEWSCFTDGRPPSFYVTFTMKNGAATAEVLHDGAELPNRTALSSNTFRYSITDATAYVGNPLTLEVIGDGSERATLVLHPWIMPDGTPDCPDDFCTTIAANVGGVFSGPADGYKQAFRIVDPFGFDTNATGWESNEIISGRNRLGWWRCVPYPPTIIASASTYFENFPYTGQQTLDNGWFIRHGTGCYLTPDVEPVTTSDVIFNFCIDGVDPATGQPGVGVRFYCRATGTATYMPDRIEKDGVVIPATLSGVRLTLDTGAVYQPVEWMEPGTFRFYYQGIASPVEITVYPPIASDANPLP